MRTISNETSLGFLVRDRKITLAELSEFREGVEGNVAAIAAQRVTERDIQQLKELLKQAKQHAEIGMAAWEPFCRVDNRIHVAIAKACGNRVYEFVLRMVHDNIQQYYEDHPLKDTQFMQENYQDLCDIVIALEKQQVTAVRSLMQSHVRRFNRYMISTNRPTRSRAKKEGIHEHPGLSRSRKRIWCP